MRGALKDSTEVHTIKQIDQVQPSVSGYGIYDRRDRVKILTG